MPTSAHGTERVYKSSTSRLLQCCIRTLRSLCHTDQFITLTLSHVYKMRITPFSYALLLAIVSGAYSARSLDPRRVECAEATSLHTAHPRNCHLAILQGFPLEPTFGDFHHRAYDDEYQLPVIATHGDCEITVDIWRNRGYRASWTLIHTMTQELISGCIFRRENSVLTGGSVYFSPHYFMSIKISNPGLGGNQSLVATE